MALDELVEAVEALAQRMEAGRGAAERAGDDEHVPGQRAGSAGHPLAPADRGDGEDEGRRGRRVAAGDGDARLGKALVEPDDVLDLGLGRKRQADEQGLRLGSHGGEVAEVDRRGLVAEIAERGPLEPEMDALDEHVLREHGAAAQERALGVQATGEPAPLELSEEPELPELPEPQGARTSTGPDPAPRPASPCRTASEAIAAAPRAASSRLSPCARSAARLAEWVQPAPCVASSA